MKIALPVMEHYTEATDGSFIEQKESALVWHHQEADPDFGTWQAKELLDHLESVLANEPVVVKRGQHIVEVKPQVTSFLANSSFKLFCIAFPLVRSITKYFETYQETIKHEVQW